MSQPSTQYYHHRRFRVAGGVLLDTVTVHRTYGEPTYPYFFRPAMVDGQSYMVGEGQVMNLI